MILGIDPYVAGWLDLIFRWFHVIAAIVWIGTSFYFVALDQHLHEPREDRDRERGVGGESWEIHGGGFYRIEKFRVAPPQLPRPLHWYKWEAYWTWLTGFALVVILYYLQADTALIDPSVADLYTWEAVADLASAGLALAWLVYDALCRTIGRRSEPPLRALHRRARHPRRLGRSELFAPRAAYLQVGAMLGTIMAANVFFVIIPAHWELVRAKEAGREPDPAANRRGKQRSVHNNYLTLPVLFTMLAGHFPFTYGHDHAWAILVCLMVIGAWVRHYFNNRHAGRTLWWIPLTAAAADRRGRRLDPARLDARLPRGAPAVTFAQVHPIVQQRCAACHSPTRRWRRGAARRSSSTRPQQIHAAGGADQDGRRRHARDAARQRHAHDGCRAQAARRLDRRRARRRRERRVRAAARRRSSGDLRTPHGRRVRRGVIAVVPGARPRQLLAVSPRPVPRAPAAARPAHARHRLRRRPALARPEGPRPQRRRASTARRRWSRPPERRTRRSTFALGDAAELPFSDGAPTSSSPSCPSRTSTTPRGAIREAARVLEPGGRFCLAIVHPLNSAGTFDGDEPDSPFVIRGSYLGCFRYRDLVDARRARVTFESEHRPIEWYFDALSRRRLPRRAAARDTHARAAPSSVARSRPLAAAAALPARAGRSPVGSRRAGDHRRRLPADRPPGGGGRAEHRRSLPPPAAARVEADPGALERPVGVDSVRRPRPRHRLRGPDQLPAPGELLIYPGGVSETEILFPYGDTCFASKAGQLAGQPLRHVVEGLEHLPAIGELVLWHGAQPIRYHRVRR